MFMKCRWSNFYWLCRNKVRKLQKKLEKTCDETSTKIETLQLTIEVNHTPKYDVNDSFADLIEALKESQE